MTARRSPDAPRYWRVSPKFWTTVQHEEWSDDARLLGLYVPDRPPHPRDIGRRPETATLNTAKAETLFSA